MRKSTWLKVAVILLSGVLFYGLLQALKGTLFWIGIGLLLLFLAWVLWQGYKIYSAWKHRQLELRQHQHEVDLLAQEVEDRKAKRRIAERQAFVEQHLALTRVYPNTRGYSPVLVSPDTRIEPHTMSYLALPSPGRQRDVRQLPSPGYNQYEQDDDQRENAVEADPIPNFVVYEDIARLLYDGEFPLGIGGNGLEVCTFEQLMTMWIVGASNTGKSNTVSGFILHAIKNGRNIRLIVVDPHATKKDSLYNRIREFEHLFLRPVAISHEEIASAFIWFKQEYKRRKEYGSEGDYDILLIGDEIQELVKPDPEMADDKGEAELMEQNAARLKRIIKDCGTATRGYGMFGWFISQNAIGLAWLRHVVHTKIIHKMNDFPDAQRACNDDAIARSMKQWPGKGRVYVYGNELPPMVLQVPIYPVKELPQWISHPARSVDAYQQPALKIEDDFPPIEDLSASTVEDCEPVFDIFAAQKQQEKVQEKEEDALLEKGIAWYIGHTANGKGPSLDAFAAGMGMSKERNGKARTLWYDVKTKIAAAEMAR